MNDRGRRADRISSPQVDTPVDVWSSPLPDPAVVSSPLTEEGPDGGGLPELQLALPENFWPEEPAVAPAGTVTRGMLAVTVDGVRPACNWLGARLEAPASTNPTTATTAVDARATRATDFRL
ncbi:MAG: hypothetical protein M3Y04_06380 [Actinomycetota bacterium]|nr:hypothetical protein [Actinomycetota bacterium]